MTAEAAQVFEDELDCTVEEADPAFPDPEETFIAILANSTGLKELRKELYDHRSEMEPALVDILETEWTAMDFTEAYKVQQKVNLKIRRFMEEYNLILTSTLAVPPFDIDLASPSPIKGRDVSLFHWLMFCFTIKGPLPPPQTRGAGIQSVATPHRDAGLPLTVSTIWFSLPSPDRATITVDKLRSATRSTTFRSSAKGT